MTANPVLITGAAQRVGLHLVHRFLEQGRPVIMTYRQHRKQIDQLTAQGVRCIQADAVALPLVHAGVHPFRGYAGTGAKAQRH
ncbi:hypothetical protein [Gallaecimonas pentaromativorans]|uniref:hypothetical protein n=1 Tax=Gallaecimonas pentaromativorans TaxID=584787 RepID=UPI001B87B650|nr:hypothetical protein [Gallaecimonas pentaromativorans]